MAILKPGREDRLVGAWNTDPSTATDAQSRAAAQTLAREALTAHAIAEMPEDRFKTDEEKTAAASKMVELMTGEKDYDGRLWNGGRGFKTGAEYLRSVKETLTRGIGAAADPDLQAWLRMSDAEKDAKVESERGFLSHVGEAAGDAAAAVGEAVRGVPRLSADEYASAPKDVREASDWMGSVAWDGFSEDERAKYEAAVRDWRGGEWQRLKRRSEYEAKLRRKNALLYLPDMIKSLQSDEAKTLAGELSQNPSEMPANWTERLKKLSTRDIETLAQIRGMTREHVEGGFFNWLGDMAGGVVNGAHGILSGMGAQEAKAAAMAMGWDGERVNEMIRRKHALWSAYAGWSSPVAQLSDEHGSVANFTIGLASAVPFIASMHLKGLGYAACAGEMMSEADAQAAAAGIDTTNPLYCARTALMGGLYAYMLKAVSPKFLGASKTGAAEDIALRTAFMKGVMSGVANLDALKVMSQRTASGALMMAMQQGIAAVNEDLNLGGDAWRDAGQRFTETFVSSIPDMLAFSAHGALEGHARASGGWRKMFTEEGRANRSQNLREAVENAFAVRTAVDGNGRIDALRTNTMVAQLAAMRRAWTEGGEKGLERLGFKPEEVAEAKDFFDAERKALGAAEKLDALERATEAESLEEIAEDAPLAERNDAARRFDEANGEYTRAVERLAETLRGKTADVPGAIRDLASVRNVWAEGRAVGAGKTKDDGTPDETDAGAAALVKAGFTPKDAAELSKAFGAERRGIYSPAATEALRDLYTRSTRGMVEATAALAGAFKGRVRTENGRMLIDMPMPDGGTGTLAVETVDLSRQFYGEAGSDPEMAREVERAVAKKGGHVTADDWIKMDDAARRSVVRKYRLIDEGYFMLTDPADPSLHVDSGDADAVIGVIRLDPTADPGAGFHESMHGFLRFCQETGFFDEADIKWLTDTYGKPENAKEQLNEESAADGFRQYLAKRMAGSFVEEPPPFRKLFGLIGRLRHLRESRAATERLAANAEEALYDALLAGKYQHIRDLKFAEPAAPKAEAGGETPAPQTGAKPKAGEAPAEAQRVVSELPHVEVPRRAASYSEARQLLKAETGKPFTNAKSGIKASLSGNSINKILSGKAVAKSVGVKQHLAAAANIVSLFEGGELRATEEGNRKGVEAAKRIFARFDLDGESLVAKITVLEHGNGDNRIYSVEAMEVAKAGSILAPKDSTSQAENPALPSTPQIITQSGGENKGENSPRVVSFEALTPTGGKKVKGHYEIVPLASLLHSNKPGYPMELQQRDRKDNKGEEQTREDHIANFEAGYLLADPKTDSGAMVVARRPGPDGKPRLVVVSGNGRTMVLEEMAKRNLYDRYRNRMKEWAKENGVENAVADADNPVLVRVVDEYNGATLKELADLSNTNAIQQMNEEETARADADLVRSLDLARLYKPNMDGSANMAAGASDEFFRAFVRATGDTSLLNSDGTFTEALRMRARRALLAIACGQGARGRDVVKKLVEDTNALGIDRQKDAAAAIAPHVAAAESRPEYAIGPDVSRAFADYIEFRENRDTGKKWGTLEEFLKQGDMLDPRSEIAEAVMRLLDDPKGAPVLAETVRLYAEAAKGETDGLFGAARTRAEIWRDAAKAVDEKAAQERARNEGAFKPETRFSIRSEADGKKDDEKKENVVARVQPSEQGQNRPAHLRNDTTQHTLTLESAAPVREFGNSISQDGVKSPAEFLTGLVHALGSTETNPDRTQYFDITHEDGKNLSLRVANHRATARQYTDHGNTADVKTSIVVKMSDKPFLDSDGVELTEHVYFSDRLTAEREAGIAHAVAGWIATGEWNGPAADQVNMSPHRRFSISGIYTGTAADYANRSRQGGVDDGPSLLKIGTGEGSQVYGWGLYGSNVRGVAEGYAVNGIRDPRVMAKNFLAANKTAEAAIKALKEGLKINKSVSEEVKKTARKAIKILQSGESIPDTIGNLYEQTFFTDRAPGDESHLLKWYEDLPKEQVDWIAQEFAKEGFFVASFSKLKGWTVLDRASGKKLSVWDKRESGETYEAIASFLGSPQAASEFLARAGIDGVKYPVDSYGGKGVKDGDVAGWNYVSFRDDNIRVDHKWTDGQMRYSIRSFSDGTPFVEVDNVPDEIRNETDPDALRSKVEDLIRSRWMNKIIDPQGVRAFVNGRTAHEYIKPAKPLADDELRAKMNAAGNLDEVVATSGNARAVPDGQSGHVHENVKGWEHRDAIFRVDGRFWAGKVNIAILDKVAGKTGDFRKLHDLTGLKEITDEVWRLHGNPVEDGQSYPSNIGDNAHSVPNPSGESKRFSIAARLETPQFKNFFGDWEKDPENSSKVVDKDGRPLVVYRRDNEAFTVFDSTKTQQNDAGWLGKGFYFYGDKGEAERETGYGKNLRAFYLNIRNPYYITSEEYNKLVEADDPKVSREFTESLKAEGYDGVYWNGDLRQEWAAFEPTQIKSATDNTGAFDPRNPDIRYSLKAGTATDYSWATLTAKPDMQLAQIDPEKFKNYKSDSERVKDAHKSVIAAGGEKIGDNYYIRMDGERVLVGNAGIKHRGRKANLANDFVFPVLGEVLKNAVRVNELEPRANKKQDKFATDIFVYLGGLSYGQEVLPVRIQVEHRGRERRIDRIDVLRSLNTKIGTVAALGGLAPATPVPGTAAAFGGLAPAYQPLPAISISNLIRIAQPLHPDIFSRDVAANLNVPYSGTKIGARYSVTARTPSDEIKADPEAFARRSVVSRVIDGDAEERESALVAFVAERALRHGPKPNAFKTIARLGLEMGLKTVDASRIVTKGEALAERVRGTVIEKAIRKGDVATATALLAREADIDRLVAGAAGQGGQLVRYGEGRIKSFLDREIEKAVRSFNAASLADVERDTGIDIADEILHNRPEKFDPKGAKRSEERKADGGEAGGEGPASGDSSPDEGGLTDFERARRERVRKDAEERVARMIATAKERVEAAKKEREDREALREERRRKAEAAAAGVDGGQGGGGSGGGGEGAAAGAGAPDPGPRLSTWADFKTPEEFAAFFRVWAEERYKKEHGASTLGKHEEKRLFPEFYRKAVVRELQDLADKLLPPKGARATVNRWLGEVKPGVRPDTLERISADVFAYINRNAIREGRTAQIQKFRNGLKEFIEGAQFDDLKLDADRRVTGWVEEAARYIRRVCNLSIQSINGEPSQLEKERAELQAILDRRSQVYDDEGKNAADAPKSDMETRRALAKLQLLDKYGAMRRYMPGEIADLADEAMRWLRDEAGKLEAAWKDARETEESIRSALVGGIVGPGGQKYKRAEGVKGWAERLFDSMNGMIRLRLQHLVRFADSASQQKARDAINRIMVMLGDGEVEFARHLQDDRAAFHQALAQIFQRPGGGGVDRRALADWLNRMTEAIPADLSRKLSRQGYGDSMTYGQMLQLLVSLEQKSYAEAIAANKRDGQADLIRTFETVGPDGRRERVLTDKDIIFIDWLRSFYEAKRGTLSEVTKRMTGLPVDSPDPLYCPVKMYMGDRARGMHVDDSAAWDPIGAVFSRRVETLRDFDESASILGQFFDRSAEAAKLVAWGERGAIIRGVFTNASVQESIRRAFGGGELSAILKQLEETFNGGENIKKSPGEIAAADKAMNWMTYLSLGYNPLSAMKQTTSFTVWANALPGGFKDLWRYMTDVDMATIRHIRESEEFKVRYGNEVGSGHDVASKGLFENPSESPVAAFFRKTSMGLLRKGDFLPGGWIAQGVFRDLYNRHLKEGMDAQAADKLAMTETFNMLEETQQSGRTYNTAALAREHGRLGRLLVQFATSPLQQLQYETQAMREVWDLKRYKSATPDADFEKRYTEAKGKLIRAAVINHVFLPAALHAVTSLYRLAMGYDPEWEQEGWHWTLLRDITLGQFSRVFFIGAISSVTADALITGKPIRDIPALIPAEGVVKLFGNIAVTARDVATLNYDRMQKDIDRLLKSTSITRTPYDAIRLLSGKAYAEREERREKRRQKEAKGK